MPGSLNRFAARTSITANAASSRLAPRSLRAVVRGLAIIASLLVLSKSAFAAPEFVKVQNGTLSYKGAPFHIAGTNTYSLLYSMADAEKQFKEARSLGLNSIRTWGFWNLAATWTRGDGSNPSLQPMPGDFPEAAWVYLDYVVALAGLYDIKLIMPLNNNWRDFGGSQDYLDWAKLDSTNNALFWTNVMVRDMYKAYVLYALNRENTFTKVKYKDDPAIMIWEVINEPRNQGGSDPTGAKVAAFLNDLAKYIHDNDPNHLVSTGEEGFLLSGQNNVGGTTYPWVAGSGEGTNFVTNAALSNIDVLTFHLWPYNWFGAQTTAARQDFIGKWISEHVRLAKAANKPLYLGEFGLQVLRISGDGLPERDAVYKAAYDAVTAAAPQLSGALYWNMVEKTMPEATYTEPNFDVFCPVDTSTCDLIKMFATGERAKNPAPVAPTCLADQTACGEDCANLVNQPGPLVKHCGTCETTCSPGQACVNSVCGTAATPDPGAGGSTGNGGGASGSPGAGAGGQGTSVGGASNNTAGSSGLAGSSAAGSAPVGGSTPAVTGGATAVAGTAPVGATPSPADAGCGCRLESGGSEPKRGAQLGFAALGLMGLWIKRRSARRSIRAVG